MFTIVLGNVRGGGLLFGFDVFGTVWYANRDSQKKLAFRFRAKKVKINSTCHYEDQYFYHLDSTLFTVTTLSCCAAKYNVIV